MPPQTHQRFELLRQLTRYENAYKRALQFARTEGGSGLIDLNSPMYEVVRLFKSKVNHIRLLIRSS